MRIIAGTAGGIPILCPKSVTRPTSDRVREALFSILGDRSKGARVLDLYAGSGALGLEALSRGAASAVFIEQNREARQIIESNIAKARLMSAKVVQATVESWLKRSVQSRVFDLVFADPPYCKDINDTNLAATLVQSKELANVLAPDGLVILETQSGQDLQSSRHFSLVDQRVYGSTALHLLSHADEEIAVEE